MEAFVVGSAQFAQSPRFADEDLENLDPGEVALLQACVGFHAKEQTDPNIRQRLYQLWCKLEHLKRAL